MQLRIREVLCKSVLSKSGIPGVDYCINPYVGCSHACVYCYATFMKKFTGHTEPWGHFVDIKTNSHEMLGKQLKKAAKGTVMLSSVTDPYQPVEAKYRLTRQCLELLMEHQYPVDILTKSSLVLRDLDIIKQFHTIEVGMTITTDNERIRSVFEPAAASLEKRLETLKTLYEKGIRTYAFIGPVLPMNPEALAEMVRPYIHSVLIDKMNYIQKSSGIYKQMQLQTWLDKGFTDKIIARLRRGFTGKKVTIC